MAFRTAWVCFDSHKIRAMWHNICFVNSNLYKLIKKFTLKKFFLFHLIRGFCFFHGSLFTLKFKNEHNVSKGKIEENVQAC